MEVARTLREARTRAGLTQAALAARAGTSQATISAYESGSKQPSVETLSRLLAATGTRLTVERAPAPVIEPTRADQRRAARDLAAALTLAEALPAKPGRVLRFPRLPRERRAA